MNKILSFLTRLSHTIPRAGKFIDLGLFLAVLGGCYLSITLAEVSLAFLCLYLVFFRPLGIHKAILSFSPRFWFTYGSYVLWSVISVALALDFRLALVDSKDLYLYLMPVVAMVMFQAYTERGPSLALGVIILGTAVNLLIGLFQIVWKYNFLIERRIEGLQAHYVTFSGLTMIGFLLLVAYVEFRKPRWIAWGYGSIIIMVIFIIMSMTRSAWLGTLVGVSVLGLLYGWRLFLKIAGGLTLAVALAWYIVPSQLQERVTSFIQPSLTSNQTRLWLLQISVNVIGDYPFTGIGPDNWQRVYQNYRLDPMPVGEMPVHFHNNLAQIAVERGIPALLFWLGWYMNVLFELHRTFSRYRDPTFRWQPAAALAIWIALGIAGFFDYNFGDSEIKLIWLMLPALGFPRKNEE